LLTPAQRDRIEVVLVSPRNPLNIGAVARAISNFGFAHLGVVSPYEPHWREARSAIGSEAILQNARQFATLAEATSHCTLVLGTGTLTYRKPEQPVVPLNQLAQHISAELHKEGRIAVVFGPENHGLTREDLSRCHLLVEIPTSPQQPSMNLGQAAAVILYELGIRELPGSPSALITDEIQNQPQATSGNLDALAGLIEEVMIAANYSPKTMQAANRRDLRVMLRRLRLNPNDTRRTLGLFRRILWQLRRHRP
jgi:TrmH family RNA methyltransferase